MMNLTIDESTTVREIVLSTPHSRNVLESFGIDYCCGGGQPLKEAATQAAVSVHELIAALTSAETTPTAPGEVETHSWVEASLTELMAHIENTHHLYLKETLPRLGELFTKVLRAHGEHHGAMLAPLHAVFSGLRTEIEWHLRKEEAILFPYIRQLEAAGAEMGTGSPIPGGTIHAPIRQMEVEHENAGKALVQMRSLTGNYTLPADACPTFAALFETLQALEADLHEHIHLENNILFPRAVTMEREGG